MSVSSQLSADGNDLIIKIDGQFNFQLHKDFRASYKELESAPKQITVDLSNSDYLDSSALGMLLLLRDYADNKTAKVTLTGCGGQIMQVLEIARFERLFDIR